MTNSFVSPTIVYLQAIMRSWELDDMEEKVIISRSDNEYTSPLVQLWKKNGNLRICTDVRWLNARTVKDAFPLPYQSDGLAGFGGNAFFSTMDFTSGL